MAEPLPPLPPPELSANEGSRSVAKRKRGKAAAQEAVKFVESEMVQQVMTIHADQLRIDTDLSHGQVRATSMRRALSQ